MTWLQSSSGNRLDLLNLKESDIDIEDIAHCLANTCRFNGATKRFYSVAEHCCHVAAACPPILRPLALLHDAPEMIIGDIVGPLKSMLRVSCEWWSMPIADYERRIMDIIASSFGIRYTPTDWYQIVSVDKRLLAAERLQVFDRDMAEEWGPLPEPLPVRLEFWNPERARSEYLSAAMRLGLHHPRECEGAPAEYCSQFEDCDVCPQYKEPE
jgi:hypothetical protein